MTPQAPWPAIPVISVTIRTVPELGSIVASLAMATAETASPRVTVVPCSTIGPVPNMRDQFAGMSPESPVKWSSKTIVAETDSGLASSKQHAGSPINMHRVIRRPTAHLLSGGQTELACEPSPATCQSATHALPHRRKSMAVHGHWGPDSQASRHSSIRVLLMISRGWARPGCRSTATCRCSEESRAPAADPARRHRQDPGDHRPLRPCCSPRVWDKR